MVTFTARHEGAVTHYRCRETGVCYSIEPAPRAGYIVRDSGVEIGRRNGRSVAFTLVEQQARLALACSVAECKDRA